MLITFAALFATLAPLQDGHSPAHPVHASLYWEIASTPDIVAAYRSSGWVAAYEDEELRDALADLWATSEAGWDEVQAEILSQVHSKLPAAAGLAHLRNQQGASISLTVEGGDLGAWAARYFDPETDRARFAKSTAQLRVLIDLDSEDSAAAALAWIRDACTDTPLEDALTGLQQDGQRIELRLGSLQTADDPAQAGPSLAERWGQLGQALGEPSGAPLVSFWNAGGTALVDRIEDFIPYIGLDGPYGHLLSAMCGAGPRMLSHGGAWRVTASEGIFRTEGHTPKRPGTLVDEVFGAKALTLSDMELLHPEAVLGGVIALDQEAFAQWMESLFAHDLIRPQLQRMEEEGGLDPKRHLIHPVGGAMGWSLQGKLGLGMPPLLMGYRLADPAAAKEALVILATWATEEDPTIQVVQRDYKGVGLLTLKVSDELAQDSPQAAAMFQPTFAVLDDRMLISLSPLHAKREIKRLQKLGEDQAQLPLALPVHQAWEGSSQIGFGDWMGLVGKVYELGRSMAPLIAASGEELPIDLAMLPPAHLLTRHFQPSHETHWNTPAGYRYESRSSVGPESNLFPLFGLGMLASLVVPQILENLDDARTGKVKADLALLHSALIQFAINNGGKFPDSLSLLVLPDTNGVTYLRNSEIPKDAWGNAYLYEANGSPQLWSAGPDGLDANGSGDDITYEDVLGQDR